MTDELKAIKEEIAKAQEQYKNAVMTNLRLLVATSSNTSSVGNNYISVELYDHKILELRDGELIFVNGDLTTYSIDNGDYELSDFEDIIRIEAEGREQEVKEKREREQYELAQEIYEKVEINIVTCGGCGDVMLHRTSHEGDLTCPSCGMESDPCDFPDLFY